MAIQKRKAVARASGKLVRAAGKACKDQAKASKKQLAEQEEAERETADQDEDEEEEEEEAGSEQDEEEQEVNEEERIKQEEGEMQGTRRKELKGMYIDELKELASSKGIEPCKKEDMIEAIVAFEAKQREDARAHQAKLRAVVVEKKEQLEAMPLPELREVCNDYGIKGQLTKQARIEQVMQLWQQADGVDKALAQRAREERARALEAMDKARLQRLCEKAGVEAFVQEVMVERLVRAESAAGSFARPSIPMDPEAEDEKPKRAKKADMVDVLLENEARRKKEAELKKQQEEVEAAKRKELRAMSVEELKKALSKKKQDVAGKKEEMVEALYQLSLQEEALAARKGKLRGLALEDLKKLVTSRGLAAGKKDDMVEAVLAHEAQALAQVKAYEAKIEEALAKMKEDLEGQSAAELKDLCAAKDLKLGASKEQRIETLLEDARASGEITKVVAKMAMAARTAELRAQEPREVLKLCQQAGVDPLVKEILVERLLAHEAEFGPVEPEDEPKAKRPRRR